MMSDKQDANILFEPMRTAPPASITQCYELTPELDGPVFVEFTELSLLYIPYFSWKNI